MAEYIRTQREKVNNYCSVYLINAFRKWSLDQEKNNFQDTDYKSLEKELKRIIKFYNEKIK
jgi:hypothetical protein